MSYTDPLANLWNISSPPQEFYIEGTQKALLLLSKLPEKGLAIVGTRNPHFRSEIYLKKWILELKGSDLIIISGLARGIDAIAHEIAIQAELPTIAILGAGLNLNYPQKNKELRHAILAKDGLIVSEFPPETPARGYHFLKRNRIIAGWSKATWIIEAGQRSGALNTAYWAREQNKPCLAVPCFPGDLSLSGNQTLLDRDHAIPFWGIHSLGSIWLELAAFPKKSSSSLNEVQTIGKDLKISPEALNKEILKKIAWMTIEKGGCSTQELLNDWISQQKEPQTFFLILQNLIQKKIVSEYQGILISTIFFDT